MDAQLIYPAPHRVCIMRGRRSYLQANLSRLSVNERLPYNPNDALLALIDMDSLMFFNLLCSIW
jgi:hypothetical protein